MTADTASIARAEVSPVRLVLAIDPGTSESGWVEYDGSCIIASGVMPNHEMLKHVIGHPAQRLAIEMIASYGMAVGKEVFETCLWIGRFMQASHLRDRVELVYRKDVKMHLCGTPRAKDANIRQALIDKLGQQGTKKAPGPTYGVKSHAWPALAVAVTAIETRPQTIEPIVRQAIAPDMSGSQP